MVELTLRTIPKSTLQNRVSSAVPRPFTRDCALKKEIEKITREKNNNNNNNNRAGPKNVGRSPTNNTKSKTSGGEVSVEVLRKKPSKKRHRFVSPNSTWLDVLHKSSSVSSADISEKSLHTTADELTEPLNEVTRGQTLSRQPVRNSPMTESRSSDSTKGRNIHQQSCAVQTSILCPAQPLPYNENLSSCREDRKKTESIPEKIGIRFSPQQRTNAKDNALVANNFRSRAGESQEQDLEVHSEQARSGNDRLLSDDVNASPFGESALQLLRELKERLRKRGDSQDSDVVGVLEAFISGQGTSGGVGEGNPPPSVHAASYFPPVFPPDQNIYPSHSHVQQNHKSVNRLPQTLYSENKRKCLGGGSNVKQTTEESSPQNVQSQQGVHDFRFKIPDHPINFGNYPIQSSMQHIHSENLKILTNHDAPHSNHHQAPQDTNGNEELLRELARQKEVNADQERIIKELRKLSARLIAQQEQITTRNHQQDKEVGPLNCESHIDGQPHVIDGDSGVGIDSNDKSLDCIIVKEVHTQGENEDGHTSNSEAQQKDEVAQSVQNHRYELLRLQTENAALLREVRSHRELVMNLEIQLTKANYLLNMKRQSQSGLTARKLSNSVPNLDTINNHMRTSNKSHESASNCSESEADSAYEEKTGSRLTSKMSSPHLDQQKKQDSGTGSSDISPQHPKQNYKDSKIQEGTVPLTVQNSTNVRTCEFIIDPCIHEIQKLTAEEIKASENSRIIESQTKVNDPTNYKKKLHKMPSTQNLNLARTRGVLSDVVLKVSDLDPKPWIPIEEPTFSSFSTINELNPHDSLISHETSFLKGIQAPRHNQNLNSQESKYGSHQPLESTRVQENSQPTLDVREDDSSAFVPMKAFNSYSTITFKNVDILE